MNNFLIYLFEANVALLLFGAFYYVFLRKDMHFDVRRLYILGMTVFSLLLPFLHFNLSLGAGNRETVKTIQTLMLPELVITAGQVQETAVAGEWSWFNVAGMLYITGTLILGAWFLFQLGQVVWFFVNSRTRIERHPDHILIYTNGTLPTFSFFRLLFLDNSMPVSEEEKECIIAHELAHIRQLHSLDILLLESVKIIFWMNPVCWFFRHQIQDLHEYLADEKIISRTSPEDYSSLLARMALNKAHLSIGHHFSKSKTLKRIKMMKTTKTQLKRWKFAALAPILGIILLVFSCNDEAMDDMQQVVESSTMTTNLPADVEQKMNELQAQYPDAKFNYMETDMKNEEKVGELKSLDPNTIAWMNVTKDDDGNGTIGMIVKVNGTLQKVGEMTKDGDVFIVVEEPAKPMGGYEEFYQYIADNLTYPEEARNMGIEGKVFIQMIIDTDGSIMDVHPVKGIGAGCDEEAVRVISQAPAWTPAEQRGKAVKQKIVLPIVFSLGNAPEKTSQQGAISINDQNMNVAYNNNGGLVTGKVTKENGEPLPGVNVVLSGTNSGTVTDLDGAFKIKAPAASTLVFSYIGFGSERISVE